MTCTKVSSQYLFLANPQTDLKTKSNEHEMTQLRSKNKLLLKAAASSAKKDGLVTEVFLRQVESRPRLVSQVHHLTHQVTSLSLSSLPHNIILNTNVIILNPVPPFNFSRSSFSSLNVRTSSAGPSTTATSQDMQGLRHNVVGGVMMMRRQHGYDDLK